MKARLSFVSNSSSSSFVVIGNSGHLEQLDDYRVVDGVIEFGKEGITEFGWGPGVAKDIDSRINFAYLQAKDNPQLLEMLETLIREHTGVREIRWMMTDEYNNKEGKVWAYIDHQSAACEGANMEMFVSPEALKNFLFDYGSKIVLDNDNS